MNESQSWRRGFTGGFMALALSIGGQVATGGADARPRTTCRLSRSAVWERFSHRATPQTEEPGLAQRVARAVLGAVLHGSS